MLFDEFGQFFRQLPPALICNTIVMIAALGAAIVYFGFIKPMRAQRKLNQMMAEHESRSAQVDDLLMPDLSHLTEESVPRVAVSIPQRKTGEYAVKLANGRAARGVEVLSILRDSSDERLILQMGNMGYRTLLDSPDVKAAFTALMKELSETIAQPDDQPEQEQSDFVMADADLDMPDLDDLSSVPDAPKHTPATNSKIPGALPNYRQHEDEPKITRQGIFRPPKVEFKPLPELNIASAIEAYLQHKLRSSPEYQDREFHVHSAPGGGVVIQVDDTYYDAVGDITDAEVRAFISGAIQEWQESQ